MTGQDRQKIISQLGLLDLMSNADFSGMFKAHEENIIETFKHILNKIVIDKNIYQSSVKDFKECLIYNFNEEDGK